MEEIRPRAVLLENVPGLRASLRGLPSAGSRAAAGLGYEIWWGLVHASDHGVPQLRPRFVLVAIKPLGSRLPLAEAVAGPASRQSGRRCTTYEFEGMAGAADWAMGAQGSRRRSLAAARDMAGQTLDRPALVRPGRTWR